MQKAVKILTVILIALILVWGFSTVSMATEDYEETVGGLFEGGQDTDTTGIENVGASLVNIITTVGIIVAVIVLLIIGIKYLMGSASEKAEYKKTMIPYLVGAVIIFGASAIAKAVIAMTASIAGAADGGSN